MCLGHCFSLRSCRWLKQYGANVIIPRVTGDAFYTFRFICSGMADANVAGVFLRRLYRGAAVRINLKRTWRTFQNTIQTFRSTKDRKTSLVGNNRVV